MNDKYYTITEYAKKVGISRQGVYYRIKNGLVEAELIAGRWLIKKTQPKIKASDLWD